MKYIFTIGIIFEIFKICYVVLQFGNLLCLNIHVLDIQDLCLISIGIDCFHDDDFQLISQNFV